MVFRVGRIVQGPKLCVNPIQQVKKAAKAKDIQQVGNFLVDVAKIKSAKKRSKFPIGDIGLYRFPLEGSGGRVSMPLLVRGGEGSSYLYRKVAPDLNVLDFHKLNGEKLFTADAVKATNTQRITYVSDDRYSAEIDTPSVIGGVSIKQVHEAAGEIFKLIANIGAK